jgi:carboxyl-terminal processing protease
MKKIKYPSLLLTVFLFALMAFVSSCKDEDSPSPSHATNEDNVYVNNWIREKMEFWYLWNTSLPASVDKNEDPEQYFDDMLNADDRFSWIQPNYQELLNSLKGINKESGMEYVLYKEGTDNVIAQVLYVKANSPAEAAGLVRGDIITKINGKQMTVDNYKDIIKELKENHTLEYKSVNPGDQTFSELKTVSLNTLEFSENPNHLHKVITAGDRKIGYYVYTFFAGGPSESSQVYDNEMDEIFSDFKAQGITDLVLDLRFNSGGSESSSKNLASLIAKGINDTKTFARREYNKGVEDAIKNDPGLGADYLITKFAAKTSNIGDLLTDGRIYVLTSTRTASASELVINALKPYMDVFIIGDTTYGKNVGSLSFYEENDPKNTWGMQPIIVKVYNSLDQSDYSKGFTPNVLDKDNSLYIYPLGDTHEALLRHAVEQITGVAVSGRQAQPKELRAIVGHSLDQKRGSFNLTIDKNPLQ